MALFTYLLVKELSFTLARVQDTWNNRAYCSMQMIIPSIMSIYFNLQCICSVFFQDSILIRPISAVFCAKLRDFIKFPWKFLPKLCTLSSIAKYNDGETANVINAIKQNIHLTANINLFVSKTYDFRRMKSSLTKKHSSVNILKFSLKYLLVFISQIKKKKHEEK